MDLTASIDRLLKQLGYELVDLEMSNRGKLLRLFIDKQDGVTIDDCVFVSNQVSHYLAVENDVDYDRLEVSSPGLDRVLKKPEDFERFAGHRAKMKLRVPAEGNKKNFIGVLRGLDGGNVVLETEDGVCKQALSNIEKARLAPDL